MKVLRKYNRHFINYCPFLKLFTKERGSEFVKFTGNSIEFIITESAVELLNPDDPKLLAEIVSNLDKFYKRPNPKLREKFKDQIDFDNYKGAKVVYVGNCNLDTKLGWNGAPNSVWGDSNVPASVNEVHYRFVLNDSLFD